MLTLSWTDCVVVVDDEDGDDDDVFMWLKIEITVFLTFSKLLQMSKPNGNWNLSFQTGPFSRTLIVFKECRIDSC